MPRKPLPPDQAERARERARAHYAANKEKEKANVSAWQAANPEKVKAYKQKHADENQEYNRERARKYRHDNPEKRCAWEHARRARRLGAGGKLSTDLLDRLMVLQQRMCACCRIDLKKVGAHMDHIIPLSAGGPNTDDNIQLLCPTCNVKKGAKHPVDFMQQRGLLL